VTKEIDRSRRVVVTGPRTRAVPGATQRGVLDLDEQTTIGEVYLRSLIRTQLRLALTVCVAMVLVGGGLPLLFALWPEARTAHVLGLQLPWLALGLLAYPALAVGGWVYVRAAERTEANFVALVERR
jgi:drug/metabolite transporter (DMT)-like permease